MMTRKDYIRAAWIVSERRKNAPLSPSVNVGDELENAFVEFFRGDNPRFDQERFSAACKK